MRPVWCHDAASAEHRCRTPSLRLPWPRDRPSPACPTSPPSRPRGAVGRSGRRGTYASTAPADRARSTRSTPRRPPSSGAARRPRVQLHPHRHRRPLPADARQDVFYPMGWDDNGLPTERRVENYYGVRCDPSLPYDPDFAPPADARPKKRDFVPISRRNFVELCHGSPPRTRRSSRTCSAGSACRVDWSMTYTTIGERAQRASPARLPAQPRRGARPTRPRRRPSGTTTSRPRSPRPSSRTASGPAPTTGSLPPPGRRPVDHRHHPARAAGRPASPWSPTPTTSATSRCSAPPSPRRSSASRSRSRPTPWPSPTRAPASP